MSKDCGEIIVVIGHPYRDIEVTLAKWIEHGPGPRRYVQPIAAKCSDGKELPLSVIPLRYRNNTLSRLLIRLKLFQNPWW